MIQELLNEIRNRYALTEIDNGEYGHIDKSGMHFEIHSYTLEGIGNVSTVKMRAMLGLMKMESFVMVPLLVDAPLFSFDYIQAFGKKTLLAEGYDLCINKGKEYLRCRN